MYTTKSICACVFVALLVVAGGADAQGSVLDEVLGSVRSAFHGVVKRVENAIGSHGHDAEALLRTSFEEWMMDHEREYEHEEEKENRFAIYRDNMIYAQLANKKAEEEGSSLRLGATPFADHTVEEFNAMYKGYVRNEPRKWGVYGEDERLEEDGDEAKLPKSWDWREHNAVTPVHNQGQCGSCWAFSATQAIEGVWAIHTNQLVSLSEEEIVQCNQEDDHGCMGGFMQHAFEWVEKNGGLDTLKDYPYTSGTGMTGSCNATKETTRKVAKIGGYKNVKPKSSAALKHAVHKQPVSIAIDAAGQDFMLYTSGVLKSTTCGETLDHGVLVVGYDVDESSGEHFWIVKNSWSSQWGEKGYVRMFMEHGKEVSGTCGMYLDASYPTPAEDMISESDFMPYYSEI